MFRKAFKPRLRTLSGKSLDILFPETGKTFLNFKKILFLKILVIIAAKNYSLVHNDEKDILMTRCLKYLKRKLQFP